MDSNSVFHSMPQMIEAALLSLADISEQLADTRESLKDAELEAIGAAIEARTEDGSKPLYTNDKSRELAARKALKSDDSYQRDRETARILEHKKLELEAAIERVRREYRISLIEFEARTLGHREAA